MPPTGENLSAAQYLAVTAYILQANGAPAGEAALTADDRRADRQHRDRRDADRRGGGSAARGARRAQADDRARPPQPGRRQAADAAARRPTRGRSGSPSRAR